MMLVRHLTAIAILPLTGTVLVPLWLMRRHHVSLRLGAHGAEDRHSARHSFDTVVQTYSRVVSQDGKTMTITTTGTNAKGQKTSNVAVFEKK